MSKYAFHSYFTLLLLFLFAFFTILASTGFCIEQKTYAINDLLVPSKIGHDDFIQYAIEEKVLKNEFKIYEIGDIIVCFYQRKIDNVIIEKDFLNYQFDRKTGALLKKLLHWRMDLVHLPPITLSSNEANYLALSTVSGAFQAEVLWSNLYIISPESDVYPLAQPTHNPCWIIRLQVNGNQRIDIYDAVTHEFLGNGIVPPEKGFSLSGPQYSNPCSGVWDSWYLNAEYWFVQLGYPTTATAWPRKKDLQSNVENPEVVLFYELAHGNSSTFVNGCPDGENYEFTYAWDIEEWLLNSPKKSFAFIGSCEGLCYITDNTFSYEFRKGSNENTATVGYCGMSTSHCDVCWSYSISWQSSLFNYMYNKYQVKTAFDRAGADYPWCVEDPACMRFAGDETHLVPVKQFLLIQKATPHLKLDWYPPNISRILYTQSMQEPFQLLFDGVTPSTYHFNALTDNNNYYYLFELQ
ncbi:MAG: hypothetical protein A2Y62_10280 [Candidatus Fischerbacteria bacterium RBG_13_37_8]|uniref:Uncharacterized protein n=1 Tax=Candidatus Fischerbacteria bacterium RBG_13_37_8 TaxID=1817863 RepID=A0A1F5VXX9_9BACT|nr:MAG: hypothetical protein A2Y62_10280 [Candidatus Fischerbacteria bacterium RBG_13_37_8]